MIAKAELRFVRQSPTKIRQVTNLIYRRDVESALSILANLNKRPKEPLIKLLKQAIANAKVKGLTHERLYISRVICNVGPTWKRYKAAAFGRATPIKKRTAHIKIELDIKSG